MVNDIFKSHFEEIIVGYCGVVNDPVSAFKH